MKRLGYLKHLISYMKDPEVGLGQKLFLGALIVYVLSPLDLIPEPVFGLGLLDDLIMVAYIWSHFLPRMKVYEKGEPKAPIPIRYEFRDDESEEDEEE